MKEKTLKVSKVLKELDKLQMWLSDRCECTQSEQCRYCYTKQVLDEFELRVLDKNG